MKIVFICGSLEMGHDGVGDYTRRLAGELTRSGHQAAILAINDRHLSSGVDGIQKDDATEIETLRIPSNLSYVQKVDKAKSWIAIRKPEWISLQFVPYSFHKKGIPWSLQNLLLSIGKGYRLHIMFHEIWLDSTEKFGQNLIRQIQKLIVKRLINNLNPEVINVSIEYNRMQLQSLGITTELLGLFGNIPQCKDVDLNKISKYEEPASSTILYFGAAPRGEFKEELITELKRWCETPLLKTQILIVSGNSKLKDDFVLALRNSLSVYNVEVLDFGFLLVKEISYLLKTSSVGIARCEPYLLGKSGSAIAMLEHGLPIWMPQLKDRSQLDYNFRPELVFDRIDKAIRFKKDNKIEGDSLLPKIANNLVEQLGFRA